MRQTQIDRFFKLLDRYLELPAKVILAGASAASLMGHIRPSLDIDFEVRLSTRKTAKAKEKLVRAIERASRETGVAVQYSENIGGWSMIHYLDYRKTALPYKRFGKVEVKLIAPAYWTLGKMARFLELDVQDMVRLIRKRKVPPQKLILIWARALKSSDLSLELGRFEKNVKYFLRTYAIKIWGKSADPALLVRRFERACGRRGGQSI